MIAFLATHWRKTAAFLIGLVGAAGVYLICVGSLKLWLEDQPGLAIGLGAVLCLACSYLLQNLEHLILPHGLTYPPKLAGVVLLGGMGIHWIGTAVEHWLIHGPLHHSYGWLLLCGLVLAAAAAGIGYKFRHQFTRTRTHRLEGTTECRPHLLWFLSSARNPGVLAASVLRLPDGQWLLRRTLKRGEGQDEVETPLPVEQGIEKLHEALEPLQPWWNGHQLIRALRHAVTAPCRLTDVWIVASTGSGGSSSERAGIAAMLRALPELKGVNIHPPNTTEGTQEMLVDFENMEDLQAEVKRLMDRTGGGKDLTIDCTGGQKTTSIAAAIATINNHALVQYVETHPPINVLAYNCVTEHEAHAPGH